VNLYIRLLLGIIEILTFLYWINTSIRTLKFNTMDVQKVDMFLTMNARFFESYQIPAIRERLLALDDSKYVELVSANFKDPNLSLIASLMAGQLGVDRFIIGDTGLGIAKLLTCGGFLIWAIVDWFLIMDRTREINLEKLQTVL
jgi:hypothetical protein